MAIKLNSNYVNKFVSEEEVMSYQGMVEMADKMLRERTGLSSEMTDWVEHPVSYDKEEYARIKAAAADIRKKCDVFVVIGIGGSYLGARDV